MAGEISFTPSEKDYADANREWYLAFWARPKSWAFAVLFVLLLAGLGASTSYIDGKTDEIVPMAIAFALLALVLILLIYLAVYFVALPRRARRLYRQHKALQQTWTFRWSDSGISMESPAGLTGYPWGDFHRWRDGRRSLLLFLNDQLFFYLPRRLLDDSSVEEIGSLAAAAGVPRF